MKVFIIAGGSTPWQNGQLIYAEAKRQKLEVDIGFVEWPFKHLLREIERSKPDWIFLTGSRTLPPEKLDKLAKIARLVIWDADAINDERLKVWQDLKGIPSIIFSVVSNLDNTLAEKVIWKPQYYDSEFYAPTLPMGTHEIYDVVFLGGFDLKRQEWMEELKKRYRVYHSSNVFGSSMSNIYRQSRVAFGIWRDGFEAGDFATSDRIYKAMGSGCFYLLQPVKDIGMLFEAEVHLDIYDGTYEMLTDQIDYYLDNPTLRKTIADKGRAEILAKHTLKVRLPQYWEIMEKY